MSKQDVIDFFDEQAPFWDDRLMVNEEVIQAILNKAQVGESARVLDVACGTGVMIPYYLKRNIRAVTGVDISSKMISLARAKFSDPRITFINEDIESLDFSSSFDTCILYNAFPHFETPTTLLAALSKALKPGGRLTIAHGSSREAINLRHEGAASKVSMGLVSEGELAVLMAPWFHVDTALSDENHYMVSGIKK